MRIRTFLTTTMSLLTVLVFGVACALRNTFWMWIGFLCTLISGVFIQQLILRRKKEEKDGELR